jgi:cyclase
VKRARIIPALLLRGSGLVKTVCFDKPRYVGDALNSIRIFNEKMVDELVILDIDAPRSSAGPRFELVQEIASECFMPVCYGGGVRSVDDMARLFAAGVEKVALNSAVIESTTLVERAAARFGSQSIVAAVDVLRARWRGPAVMGQAGSRRTRLDPVTHARSLANAGAGELLLQSIDRDGTKRGYDLDLVSSVTSAVSIPVIALGGAATVHDLAAVIVHGRAAAAAAGSMFVFHGRHDAVLINVPTDAEIERAIADLGRAEAHP